jgi:aromatic-L-amino-acid decarboxylase
VTTELAETGHLERLLSQVGAGLDEYLKFAHPDALHPSLRWREILDLPLPERGIGIAGVTEELVRHIIPNGSPVPRPGFSAYITTGSTSAATLAATAASIASPQRYMHTAFNFLEELSLNWLADMFSIGHLQGIYSSGGSVANLIGLGAARQAAFEQIGHDPAAQGVDRRVRVYASEDCHHTIQRSAGVLGIGRQAVKLIACDDHGRMRVDELRQALTADKAAGILPMAIVANAGTTNTGAIDPLQAIGELAKENSIWFHIDGAYGLPGILDDRVSHLYRGLCLADSVIVDPHKWLGASVGVAATFVRERQLLARAFTQEPADYLEGSVEQPENSAPLIEHSMDDFGIPYFNFGVELSSPCRGVVVWALIREIGVEGLRQRVKRHNGMARNLARCADAHPNLEVLSEPTLSICCFRYVSPHIKDLDQFNQQLYRRLVRENKFMPSTTRIKGKLALRPCFLGARAESGQVDALVEAVLRIGGQQEAEFLGRGEEPAAQTGDGRSKGREEV